MDSEQLRTKLRDLALDLRWSWNHAADELWTRLDPELWALTHNAWVILETASRERLGGCVADAAFRDQLEKAFQYYEYHNTRPHWFQTAYPNSPITAVAYFSMEFMLSDALPKQGYFRQRIDADGHQEALYPYNDPTQLPISPLRELDLCCVGAHIKEGALRHTLHGAEIVIHPARSVPRVISLALDAIQQISAVHQRQLIRIAAIIPEEFPRRLCGLGERPGWIGLRRHYCSSARAVSSSASCPHCSWLRHTRRDPRRPLSLAI